MVESHSQPNIWHEDQRRLRLACCSCCRLLDSGRRSRPIRRAGPTPTVQRTTIGELPDVGRRRRCSHTPRSLSSDEYEGRGPGTKGEELTVDYLADQFRRIGLKPGNPDGTYIQKVPLVGITPTACPADVQEGQPRAASLAWKDDVVAWTKHVADAAAIENSELVFVGYGVVAPEFNWDDYKGVDVKGKTLVMLVNDPPVADRPTNPANSTPRCSAARAMTYYGRWTYKFEMRRRQRRGRRA